MASMVDAFETALLALLFKNTTLANIGTAQGIVGSTATGSTQLAIASVAYNDADTLLTADEMHYGGYVRPTQARTGADWTAVSGVASNLAIIQFGEMASGTSETAVHVGLGFLGSGNQIDLHADLTADLIVNNGTNPQFAAGALSWTAS